MAYGVIRFILEVVAIPGFLTRILSSLGRCFQYGVQPMVLSVLLPSLYLSEYLAISEDEKWHKSGKWNCNLRNRDILEKSSNLKTNLEKTNWMVWAVDDFIYLGSDWPPSSSPPSGSFCPHCLPWQQPSKRGLHGRMNFNWENKYLLCKKKISEIATFLFILWFDIIRRVFHCGSKLLL